MKFRTIKPFVIELLTFIFVVGCVIIGLLTGNLIEITFHMHLLTLTALALLLVSLVSLFSRIVNTGIRALMDFVFQSVKEDCYTFLGEQPYKASIFTEKFRHNHETSYGMYYLLHLRKGKEVYTYISSSYVDLVGGETYIIKTGCSSKVFISANLAKPNL